MCQGSVSALTFSSVFQWQKDLSSLKDGKCNEDETYSIPGRAIQQNGSLVWDACSTDVRENYPTDRDALRIVQYDSCRGLEGWTVINYAFDDFFDYKRRQFLSSPPDSGGLFDTAEDLAVAYAAQWAMIPITRAMDTLVINVSKRPCRLKDALRSVFEMRSDFVAWQVVADC